MADRTLGSKNVPSLLLDDAENDILFSLIGSGCLSLATGKVTLYTSGDPLENQWSAGVTGIACFIKDNQMMSYFIRVYNLEEAKCIWEHEFFDQENCSSFEAEMQIAQVRLDFVSEEEEDKFISSVNLKLLERYQRKLRTSISAHPNVSNVGWDPGKGGQMEKVVDDIRNLFYSVGIKNDQTVPLSVVQPVSIEPEQEVPTQNIGFPSNVRHVNHVGWDPEKGFQVEKVNKDCAVKITNKEQFDERNDDPEQTKLTHSASRPFPSFAAISMGILSVSSNVKEPQKKRKLTKENIGSPSDFRHVAGWDSEKGCKVEKLDKDSSVRSNDKDQVEKDLINLNCESSEKNNDIDETEKQKQSLSNQSSLALVAYQPPPASTPRPPSPPNGPPPSSTSRQKVGSPARTVRSKRFAQPPPPAPPPPPPPQKDRQLTQECHSSYLGSLSRTSLSENGVKMEQRENFIRNESAPRKPPRGFSGIPKNSCELPLNQEQF